MTTLFHYDFDGNIIGESDLGGTFTREYLYRGQNRLLMVDVASQTVYTYLNDRLGTPQAITDSEGNAVWEATYRPFGEPRVHPMATLKKSSQNHITLPAKCKKNWRSEKEILALLPNKRKK